MSLSLPRAGLIAALLLGAGLDLPLGQGIFAPHGMANAQTAPDATADPGAAQPGIPALEQALRMGDLFAIMAEEGAAYGAEIGAAMFPGRDAGGWTLAVARIYQPDQTHARFSAAFAEALSARPAMVAEAEAFFASDLGQKITRLEIEARRALLDDAVEEAAEVAAEKMQAERAPRLRLIRKLIEAGDLIEQNVAGSMTGYYAFNAGMAAALPQPEGTPSEEMMADLRGQEAQMRADTTAWLVSYMALAYGPLSDDEMQAYVDFTGSEAGRALNAALFSAFDAAFTPALRALGHEAGLMMVGQDI